MHIKQLTIFNFRSFREQPDIHPFSPGTNTVVGRNGSGKSNLFDAVQFVLLSPRFYSLRAEERQALLHEGAGSAAVNAFVEVVFDNSDNRFSLENSDEVVLRRTIGPKKDEFFLQRKRATKQEISSLLEGAGFSKSNPYFMIQQGKIQDICTMHESERLALLKQVAGTTVYDEKKQESLAKMEENLSSIEKIQQILTEIEQRLHELHGEKEELTTYQQLDRKRRAMEYTLYDKELRRARKILDDLEHERVDHVEKVSQLHEEARQTHEHIRNVEGVLTAKTNILKRTRNQLKDMEADKTAAVQRHTALKLECEELEDAIKSAEHQEKSNQEELQKLHGEIEKAQAQLDKEVTPKYEEASMILQQMTHDLDQNKRQAEGLHAKQGRGSHFQTKQERDDYLQQNIQELQESKNEKEATIASHRETLSNLRRTIDRERKDMEGKQSLIAKLQESLQAINKTTETKKRHRIEVQEKRQNQWRQTEELNETVVQARETMHQALSNARKVTPRSIALGLEALERVVQQEKLVVGEQYFGMLMDNITLKDPKYQTAVEVAAQNSLFHVIVDTDVTAARLMKRLEEGRLGRVTFLPLNRLRVDHVECPQGVPDIKPMLEICLDYDPKVGRAIEHVFGRKLLARTVEIGSEWSSKLKMDAITLDGDLSGSKGALSGGYVDANQSRLKGHQRQKQATSALREAEKAHNESRRQAEIVDQEAANVLREMTDLESKQTDMQRKLKDVDQDMQKRLKRIEKDKKEAQKIEQLIPALQREITGTDADIKRLQEEMTTELTSTLSDEEKQLLAGLKEKEKKLERDIEKQTDEVTKVGLEKQRLQSLLDDNLLKRKEELQGLQGSAQEEDEEDFSGRANAGRSTYALRIEQRKDELAEKQHELEVAARALHGIDSRLAEARGAEEKVSHELSSTRGDLDKLKSTDAKTKKHLEEAHEKSEKMLTKREMCISKRETYATKIQELGALPPPSERDEFTNKTVSDLMKSLDIVNKKLKKYSHVNKKAFDQYVNFSEQRDTLLKRKNELDEGAEKVRELVGSLDRQKDEAINRTFRGVSAHFKDVFKELVPLGQGELIMRTAMDEGDTDNEGEEEEAEDTPTDDGKKKKGYDPNNPDVSLYRGVQVKVRFSSVGENFIMSQLSGGQKALVALALIFAIQRCDPAPFYIFDELDQALDSSYRASVARLIQKQANSTENPTQFILSTFRPELVSIASQCYGISHQSKVSRFHHMSKKDALAFIANLMTEEEDVGEISTMSAYRTSRTSSASRKRKALTESPDEEEEDESMDATGPAVLASSGAEQSVGGD